jgi:hypothetical protein
MTIRTGEGPPPAGERDALLAKYLAGALSEEDAARVEEWWSSDPGLIRDLEATARLASGLADLRRRGELPGIVRGPWWTRPLALLSIAATLAALAVGVFAWRSFPPVAPLAVSAGLDGLPHRGAGSVRLAGTYSLLRLRNSAPVDATVSLPAAPGAIALRVLPEQPSPTGRYRLELAPADPTAAAVRTSTLAGLAPGADGFVAAYVDAQAWRPGRWRVRVVPEGRPDSESSDFLLEVRPGTAAP